ARLSVGVCRQRDGDGIDRTGARGQGNRRTDARGVLAHRPSAADVELRSPGDSADWAGPGDRDGSVHSHRRGTSRPDRLVFNHLGSHAEGLADGARSLMITLRKKVISAAVVAVSMLSAACGD